MSGSYMQLLWSLFGVIPIKDIEQIGYHKFIKWTGHALLGAYMVTVMTVMINMLIAMMSRSFEDIEIFRRRMHAIQCLRVYSYFTLAISDFDDKRSIDVITTDAELNALLVKVFDKHKQYWIGNTFTTLFWSLFGISSPKSTDLVEDDFFIETVGQVVGNPAFVLNNTSNSPSASNPLIEANVTFPVRMDVPILD
ncbi:hypothetical protein CEXT_682052 [Caerostris extrusa]|uniref:Uncharacterized protein n=1 Tax=Caerostris extrusa TaxID=172846 RepID=A0AAV4UFA3_CAEEX|nr:hypothetical protein CEXT_682052 [Caerostris extrusa]